MTSPASSAATLRPFIPALDFDSSKQFYLDLGFALAYDTPDLAALTLGAHGILLQNFYVKDFAENAMLQLVVDDLDAWWQRIQSLDLAGRYAVKSPIAPKIQPWGGYVAFLFDPAGVLWHITQADTPVTGN